MQQINRTRYLRLFEDDLFAIGRQGDRSAYTEKWNILAELVDLNHSRPDDIQYFEDMKSGHIEYQLT